MSATWRGRGARQLLLSLVSAAPLLAAGAAHAQTAASPGQGATSVAELVVTAEKRSQRLIDVPASISVVTAEEISSEHLIALSDIAEQVPNVVMSGSSLFPSITIRGVSSTGEVGYSDAVIMYVDDVYQGRGRAQNLPVCGIDRVEVLRGPQGTLYGKDTIGGAINITTQAPTDQPHASLDADYGNLNYGQVCGTVSGPVAGDKLLVSIDGLYRHRDGDILNVFDNTHLNFDNAAGGRMRVIYNATPQLTFNFEGDYLHETDTESDLTTNYSTLLFLGSLLGPPFSTVPTFNPTTRTESLDAPETGRRDVYGVSGRFDYDFAGARLTSISAYRGYTSYYAFDTDGTALNEDAVNEIDNVNQFSQEVRLTSTTQSPFQWIVGGFYYHEAEYNNYNTTFFSEFPTPLLSLPLLPAGYDDNTQAIADVVENSYAGFASATYNITSKWVLAAGVRFTVDDKTLHFSQLQTTIQPPGQYSLGAILLAHIPEMSQSLSESEPTGDASLSYKFTPDAVGYIKYSRGYKAGGFNDAVITTYTAGSSLAFKPEFLDNYEVGFKGAWWDGRVSMNIAAFYDNYTNKQEMVENSVLFTFTVQNAAKARLYGAEFEGDLKPVQGLDLTADFGLLDGTYTSFPNGGGIGINYNGNRLANAPKFTGTLAAQYHHELSASPALTGVARVEVFHSDNYFEDPNNTLAFETPAYTYLNARVGVQSDDGVWGLYLWGKNLTNEFVLSGGYVCEPIICRAVNFPRTFGVELTWRH